MALKKSVAHSKDFTEERQPSEEESTQGKSLRKQV